MSLKIEEGKYYKRRDGQVVGPAGFSKSTNYPWKVGELHYTSPGRFYDDCTDNKNDLIAEVPNPNQPDDREQLQARVEELDTQAAHWEGRYSEMKLERDELRTEIERLKARVGELEIERVDKVWDSARERDSLRNRLAEAETRNDELVSTARHWMDKWGEAQMKIAELEPKPVVSTDLVKVSRLDGCTMFNLSHDKGKAGELAITFHDGKLVSSEVIK